MGQARKRGTFEQRKKQAEHAIAQAVRESISEIDASGATLTHAERAFRANALRFLENFNSQGKQ